MKKLLILFAVSLGFGAVAASTNAPPVKLEDSFRAQAAERAKQNPATLRELKPNEIAVGKLTYSGIVVEAVKTRAPLELLNPAAPARYGSPEDNLARDPINGRIRGLKFFALRF
ncbi:MAG TPA: hypothetical protein VN578_21995 [Candidatus Binatia bacterium]|jgi:hypothetical protein|nr:hypothetical protein [Candidatus Binatia bacterium]